MKGVPRIFAIAMISLQEWRVKEKGYGVCEPTKWCRTHELRRDSELDVSTCSSVRPLRLVTYQSPCKAKGLPKHDISGKEHS
jgi:hypothetical protein